MPRNVKLNRIKRRANGIQIRSSAESEDYSSASCKSSPRAASVPSVSSVLSGQWRNLEWYTKRNFGQLASILGHRPREKETCSDDESDSQSSKLDNDPGGEGGRATWQTLEHGGALGPVMQICGNSRRVMIILVLLAVLCIICDVNLTSSFSFGLMRIGVNKGTKFVRTRQTTLSRSQEGPAVTVLSAPKPFEGEVGEMQRVALLSWLRMHQGVRVVLLGNDSTLYTIAEQFSPQVSVDSRIDTNFRGLPLFNSLIARAQQAPTEVSVFVNPDIVLLSSVYSAVLALNSRGYPWLLTGMRWDLEHFPFTFQRNLGVPLRSAGAVQLLWKNGSAATEDEVQMHVEENGVLHTSGGVDFWAWNNVPGVPLIQGAIPPFVYGRAQFGNWLVHQVVTSGKRRAVDGSIAATSIHVQHTDQDGKEQVVQEDNGKTGWLLEDGSTFETQLNLHLSQRYGSNFTSQLGTAMHIPNRLARCFDTPAIRDMCLLPRVRLGACQCQESPYTAHDQQVSRPHHTESAYLSCGDFSHHQPYNISLTLTNETQPGLPHRLEHLLAEVAPQGSPVVLTGATKHCMLLLSSFACQLRSLGVSNFIVAAFDEDAYIGAFEQGLPVYLEPSVHEPNLEGVVPKFPCPKAEPCAASELALFKASAIKRVLSQGHGVLWSDVDVVWQVNPLPALQRLFPGEAVALVLSSVATTGAQQRTHSTRALANIPDPHNSSIQGMGTSGDSARPESSAQETSAATGRSLTDEGAPAEEGRQFLDAGFFFLPAVPRAESFLNELLVKARGSLGTSEKAMYLDVLCGPKRERYDPTIQECMTAEHMRVAFIDGSLSPGPRPRDVLQILGETGTSGSRSVVHLKSVAGPEAKAALLKSTGLWHYDEQERICIHSWHPNFRRKQKG